MASSFSSRALIIAAKTSSCPSAHDDDVLCFRWSKLQAKKINQVGMHSKTKVMYFDFCKQF
jgi:hypothetical protein